MQTINSIKTERRKTKRSTLPTITYYSKPSGTCWLQASLHFLYRHFYDEIMNIKTEEQIGECAERQILKNNEENIALIKKREAELDGINKLKITTAEQENRKKTLQGEIERRKARLEKQKKTKPKKMDNIKSIIYAIQRYFTISTPENLYSIVQTIAKWHDDSTLLEGTGGSAKSFLEDMETILCKEPEFDNYANHILPTTENPLSIVQDAIKKKKDIFFYPYLEGKTSRLRNTKDDNSYTENNYPGQEHVIFCENLGNGQFKLHDNIHPEQTKIVDKAFFENEFQRLQYAKNHHEELNDYRKKKIKYKIRNIVENVLSGKGDNAMFFEQKPHNNKSADTKYKTMGYNDENRKKKYLMKQMMNFDLDNKNRNDNNNKLNLNLKTTLEKEYKKGY